MLATEATALAHGRAGGRGGRGNRAAAPSRKARRRRRCPAWTSPREELAAGIPAFRLFERAGLAKTGGEARRLIRGGGARVNDAPVTEEGQVISLADLRGGAIKLSAGRKQHRLVRVA